MRRWILGSTTFLAAQSVVLGVLLATWCGFCHKITRLRRQPDQYLNADVRLVGLVTEVAQPGPSLLNAYELSDGTGTIWVVTRRGSPLRGSRVYVQGVLRDRVPATFRRLSELGGPRDVVVIESKRFAECWRNLRQRRTTSSPAPSSGPHASGARRAKYPWTP